MASFNSMSAAMTAGATPVGDPLGLTVNQTGQSMGLEAFDHDLAFDESLLDNVNGLSTLPFTPSYDFETFSTTFEDPFSSYSSTTRPYEAAPDPESFNEGSSPQDLDNKLLGFSAPIVKATVVDETGQYVEPDLSAELFGMFFVAEDVYNAENTGRPLELTCYRRNLWQCSGQITLPRQIAHFIGEEGVQMSIFELAASITAIESIEGKTTEIISIPWKTSNPSGGEETKVAGAPPQVPIDLSSGQELDNGRVSVPVSWKRLQFKHATANNGRRKGLQQHYVVQINLLGKLKSGELLKIAEIQSGPVIVRGRSPRNFDSRKDVPLTGDKRTDRRTTSADSVATTTTIKQQPPPPPLPLNQGDLAQNLQRYHSLGNIQQAAGEWATPNAQQYAQQQSQPPPKKMALSPSAARPPVPAWSSSEGSLPSTAKTTPKTTMPRQTGPTLPINLSLSEDERSSNRSTPDGGLSSPRFIKSAPATAQAVGESPLENGDMLYEYFPLSLDDWMPLSTPSTAPMSSTTPSSPPK